MTGSGSLLPQSALLNVFPVLLGDWHGGSTTGALNSIFWPPLSCRCDQIVVLESGKAVERGTHSELLARGGKYAELWAKQATVDDLSEGGGASEGEEGGEERDRGREMQAVGGKERG